MGLEILPLFISMWHACVLGFAEDGHRGGVAGGVLGGGTEELESRTERSCQMTGMQVTVDTPPTHKKQKRNQKFENIVQRHNQDIWSNFL